jgi:hypothetical protein
MDTHAPSIKRLHKVIAERGLSQRVSAIAGDMGHPEQPLGSFDLIWSEGALYSIALRNALRVCHGLLHPRGYLAFSDAIWRKENPPPAIKSPTPVLSVLFGGFRKQIFEMRENYFHALFDTFNVRLNDDFQRFRFFIGGGNAGEFGDLPTDCFFIKSLGIPALAHGNVAFDKNFKKAVFRNQRAHQISVFLKGRNKSANSNIALLEKQLGDFPDAPNILRSIFIGKTEIATESMAQIVAVQQHYLCLSIKQFFSQLFCNGL